MTARDASHDSAEGRSIDLRTTCRLVESLIPVVQRAAARSAVLRDSRLVIGTTATGELATRIVAGVR